MRRDRSSAAARRNRMPHRADRKARIGEVEIRPQLRQCCHLSRDRSGKASFQEFRIRNKGLPTTKFAQNGVSGSISSSLSDLTRRRWMWRKMSTYGTALAEKKSDDRSDWNFQHLHLRWLNVVFGYRGRVSGLCRPAVAFVAGADGIAASDSRRC